MNMCNMNERDVGEDEKKKKNWYLFSLAIKIVVDIK